MNELIWLSIGVSTGIALTWAADWLFRFWQSIQANKRRCEARAILKRHGLSLQLYLATIDIDDAELRRAVNEFALSGYIIMNSKDEVVGKICRRLAPGPHLRLVVSND